jgi:hypothetical protein
MAKTKINKNSEKIKEIEEFYKDKTFILPEEDTYNPKGEFLNENGTKRSSQKVNNIQSAKTDFDNSEKEVINNGLYIFTKYLIFFILWSILVYSIFSPVLEAISYSTSGGESLQIMIYTVGVLAIIIIGFKEYYDTDWY